MVPPRNGAPGGTFRGLSRFRTRDQRLKRHGASLPLARRSSIGHPYFGLRPLC